MDSYSSEMSPQAATLRDRQAREEELSRLLLICGHRLYHNSAYGRSQTTVLLTLLENGPTSQKEVQERLAIQPGSMSELVTKLENKGLLLRERDAEDRRKVLLRLTEAGGSRARHQAKHSRIPIHYAELSDGDLEALSALLGKVIEGWKEDGVPEGELRGPGAKA